MNRFPIPMESGKEISIQFTNGVDCPINYLEHVQINLNVEYTKRGNLDVFLISPKSKCN